MAEGSPSTTYTVMYSSNGSLKAVSNQCCYFFLILSFVCQFSRYRDMLILCVLIVEVQYLIEI